MPRIQDSSKKDVQAWAKYEPQKSEELEPLTSDGIKVEVKGKEKEKEEIKICGFFELFRFSDGLDKLLMTVGFICATLNGMGLPVWVIIFGEMIQSFIGMGAFMVYLDSISDYLQSINRTKLFFVTNPHKFNCSSVLAYYGSNRTCFADQAEDKILDEMGRYAIYYCVLSAIILVVCFGQVACWMTSAERQAHRLRHACLANVLRQDIGWFDTHAADELNTRLSDDVHKIQEGIGDKVVTFWQWLMCSIGCLVVGFVYGWKLTLVVLAPSPLMVITTALFSKLSSTISSRSLAVYAQAGSVAEEVFGAIRTVIAFGGQEKEVHRYGKHLATAEAFGVKKGFSNGISMGFVWFCVFCMFGLSFWYGGVLFREEEDYDSSNVLIVTFAILTGAYALGMAAPSIEIISVGRAAAYTIFELIDTKSAIDSSSEEGLKPHHLTGTIRFEDVDFHYPSRPDVKVLSGVSLEAKQGQTVALVGASGCGKSTIVQLLLRFYDPKQGKVLIDGHDIRDINVKWLRAHIGLVSQEPVLFATTIAENIRYGREGVSMEEIEEATKNANAYDFIMKLPDKFETDVGERGGQLSGGQKQRLAIARALVADPKILLLDEATSALDMESESIVQDALDKAREGRTTVIVAHRLSTIKNADIIIGMNEGKVEEVGTHEELMTRQGHYYRLVMHQQAGTSDEDIEESELIEDNPFGNPTAGKARMSVPNIDEKEGEEDLPEAPFKRIMKYNSSEWPWILIGCLSSLINGGVWPTFGIIFAEVINVFSYEDEGKQEREMRMYALIFVAIGVVSFVTNFFQCYFFGRSGEALTRKLRDMSFKSMLKQDVSWFDDHKNNVGALTTRLATDAVLVQGVTGQRLGITLTNLSSILLAVIVSFIHGWQMTLLLLALFPLLAMAGMIHMKVTAGQSGRNREALEKAGKITVESIENIRTVAGLAIEPKFLNLYLEHLETPYRAALRNGQLISFVFGVSQCIMFLSYAVSFGFGAFMIEEGEMELRDVFIIFSAILFGSVGLGFASVLAPDVGKAQTSAKRIIQIIDSEPAIDHTSEEGQRLRANYEAAVTFKDVFFSYPHRKAVTVLQGLNLSVSPGQTIALVGTSGCGKTTTMKLIDRFYDCTSGLVTLDNEDVKSLNIKWLREQIGVVAQEPVLFDTTIAENIAYGDNTRTVAMDEIVSAARLSNIHTFIASLPEGYDTNVGLKGTQLSGGQKQRIAIARALVRNPKVLLLDEATSALDTESEKVVQEALDKAREGRTSIVIAHRLSTVQSANKIYVISQGKVVESGTHSELMARQGIYYKLVKKSVKDIC